MTGKLIGDIIPQCHVQCSVLGCAYDYVCAMRDLTVVPPNRFHPSLHLVVQNTLVEVICESFKGGKT